METISILIPTYNAEKYINDLFKGLYNQVVGKNQSIEIIVIDSSSTDNTVAIINEMYPRVRVETISNNSFDHGGTRNYLASLAKGNYLLFMTQDAIPYDEYLVQNLLRPLEEKEIMISYARQVPKADAKPLEVFARNFNYPEHQIIKSKASLKELGIKTFFNSNVCSMYKREVFERHNGFPEKIILNEDMILSSKLILADFSVSYTADAKVYHSHNYNLKQQFKRYFDIGMAFNQTSYLLEYASNEKEGKKMIFQQMKYLVCNREFLTLPIAILENFCKYVGYFLGKKHMYFPYKVKKRFSAYMK
ncbi:glycosyltransferase family 2 protein [Bacillus sp. GB_SG_008]|uniref:glycosyltransferase family 2 protein n=1 Tax=Bacillus sp. GB_SG_008 TaxID=3454627 RepID=UPI003F84062B